MIDRDFVARLDGYAPDEPEAPPTADQAAVAAVLRSGPDGPEVLLMRRAEQERDRWSGHVSLPGGRAEPDDVALLATAVRETREEVGLDLGVAGRPLCRLARVQAVARGRPVSLEITPFAFELTGEAELALGPEASAAFWLPLGAVARGELDAEFSWRRGEVIHKLPSWRFGEHTVWGLTHRMLAELVALLRR